jgi:hypothetical protein
MLPVNSLNVSRLLLVVHHHIVTHSFIPIFFKPLWLIKAFPSNYLVLCVEALNQRLSLASQALRRVLELEIFLCHLDILDLIDKEQCNAQKCYSSHAYNIIFVHYIVPYRLSLEYQGDKGRFQAQVLSLEPG